MIKFMSRFFFLALGCAMLLTSCVKDEPGLNFLELYAESYTPDGKASKAAVLGEYTYWVNGDDVWINGTRYDVVIDGTDVYAEGVQTNGSHLYKAVYPAAAYVGLSGTDDVTVTIPNEYYYRESGGKQVLDGLPMVAYYSGESDPEGLQFKHVTAAITVVVKNEKSDSVLLDKIELINDIYQLSGNVTVSLANPGVDSLAGSGGMVTVFFTDNKPKIAPGGSKEIQVPIRPVGKRNSTYTINVTSHWKGSKYAYSKSSSAPRDNHIYRADLGYAVTKFDGNIAPQDLFEKNSSGKYEISSPEELLTLSEAMDSMYTLSGGSGQYIYQDYVVTQNIDLGGAEMTPIHYYNLNSETPVTFDGGNHTVSNFTASSIGENDPNVCGFFGRTEGQNITIKDLNIEDATYEYRHTNASGDLPYSQTACTAVGGVIGLIDDPNTTISGCSVSKITFAPANDATAGTDMYASGIAGFVTEECTISGCSVGTVIIDNSAQTTSGKLIDQFGAAIGRIDVGFDRDHKPPLYNYTWADTIGGEIAVPNPKKITISDFTYTQGATPMIFASGLNNVRYGGLIGNVTEGGIIEISNVKLHHHVVINQPTNGKYCGGLIGFSRSSHDFAVVLNATGCVIDGYITIKGAESADKAKNGVGKYLGAVQTYLESQGDLECTNNLTFTDSSQCTGALATQKLDFKRRKPKVTTVNNTGSITATSITCKGKVEELSSPYTVTDRGVCWASWFTVGERQVEDADVSMDSPYSTVVSCGSGGYGDFEVTLTDLHKDASHYYKAYATFNKRSASDPNSTISVTTIGSLSSKHKTLK